MLSDMTSFSCNFLKIDSSVFLKLWDASTGQGFHRYSEHQKRAWSVDFSSEAPTKLASGSDDCSVKLWSINEVRSLNHIFIFKYSLALFN